MRTQVGKRFAEVTHESSVERTRNLVETFSDSDWSGSRDHKSTSAAFHVINGNVVHSTSRSQKAISLSSTEAEWYAASAACCDGLYLKHIVGFLTGSVEPLLLHVDNTAVKALGNKLGTGRLRHVQGRLMWIQQLVSQKAVEIRYVSTLVNIADLNTKALNRDRHLSLLWLIHFHDENGRVGADEYARTQTRELMRNQIGFVSRMVSEQNGTGRSKTTSSNQFAKQFLRVMSVFSLMTVSTGESTTSCSLQFHAQVTFSLKVFRLQRCV